MKIAVCGTHSVGKTTLISQFESMYPFVDHFMFIPGVTRVAKQKGYVINDDESQTYNDTQLYISSIDVQNFLHYKDLNFVSDRCILDTYVYSLYLYFRGKLDKEVLDLICLTFCTIMPAYDYVVLLNDDGHIGNVQDGVRNGSEFFREQIAKMFYHVVELHVKPMGVNVVNMTASQDQKIKTFSQVIDKEIKQTN